MHPHHPPLIARLVQRVTGARWSVLLVAVVLVAATGSGAGLLKMNADVTGMTPDHDYYDPRTDKWSRLRNMPIPVHGINGSAYVNGLIWVTGGGTNIGGAHASHHNQVFRPSVSCE